MIFWINMLKGCTANKNYSEYKVNQYLLGLIKDQNKKYSAGKGTFQTTGCKDTWLPYNQMFANEALK